MTELTLELTDMANGGAALGRDSSGRVIFVPFTIPGELTRVAITEDKGRFAQGKLLEIVQASPERTQPRCPHFGPCGGCAFQHINYPAQLRYKAQIVRDQLKRIGGLTDVPIKPVIGNPEPYYYGIDVTFSATAEGQPGFWSPLHREVIPITECHIIRPDLQELYADIDLHLPGLRHLTIRQGDDGALLIALATEDIEPPELNTDFAVSVAMVLPDGQAANLVGDNYTVQQVKGHDFRVSAGCFFYPTPAVTEALVDTVQAYAALTGSETVVDAYCGVGVLSAFLALQAAVLHGIELNPDAVADAAVNLDETDNVSLYEGLVEEVLPLLPDPPDVLIVDPPPAGLPQETVEMIAELSPDRLIYVSGDVATLARDGRQLARAGFELAEVQPLDMYPQAYPVLTVSLWTH